PTQAGREYNLRDAASDGPRTPDLAVDDRTDRHHLGGGAGEEGLVRGVEVAPEDVADLDVVAQVACDRHDRALRDPLERARARRRGDDATVPHDEEVLARALADIALR